MPIVFDIETNGLLYDVTKIHCIVTQDTVTKEVRRFFDNLSLPGGIPCDGSVGAGIEYLQKAAVIVGHNIANYDVPVLRKLTGIEDWPLIYDTFLGSCMLYPNQDGHSIEAWIERLKLGGQGIKKIPITNWSRLTAEMLDRCHDDVLANTIIYEHLEKNRWDLETWERNMSLETQVAMIHAAQEDHGVRFDVRRGVELVHLFDKLLLDLEEEIVRDAKPEVKQVGVTVTSPFKKDGDLKQVVINWLRGFPSASLGIPPEITVAGPFSKIEFKQLNLRSPQQVTRYLLGLGWKPNEWNFKFNPQTGKKERMSPKLTEKSWDTLPAGIGEKIGRFKTIAHRRNWLLSKKNPDTSGALRTVRPDGRVPAKALTCGTPTSRYRHMGTVCNLPSANVAKDGSLIWYPEKQRVLFGTEMRSLLGVQSDHWQIGVDLAGIEARMMCHYAMAVAKASGGPRRINDAQDLLDLVLDGDFHQHNADFWGVVRNTAKSGLYALMYGCGDAKLASTLGKQTKEGAKLKRLFWDNNPALKYLVEQLELSYSVNGYIKSIDGRVLDVRDKRKLLNTLLQGSSAIVFKLWMIQVHRYCMDQSVNLRQIIAYHDELQLESYSDSRDHAVHHGAEICKLAEKVGRSLGLNVPIEAEAKVGKNWAECH